MAKTVVNIEGASKVPVSTKGLKAMVELLVDGDKTPEVNIKLDGRGNVRSTYGQVVIKGEKRELRVYTGAVEALWEDLFTSKDNVSSAQEAVVFVLLSLLVDYTAGNKVDMKVANISTIQLSKAFTTIKTNWSSIKATYQKFPVDSTETKATSHGSNKKGPKALPTDDGLGNIQTVDLGEGFSLKEVLGSKEAVKEAAASIPITIEGNQPMSEEDILKASEDLYQEENPLKEVEAI